MIDLNITEDEINALKYYNNGGYKAINQILISNSDADVALLSDEVEKEVVTIKYDRESIIEYLNNAKLLYSLILKEYYQNKKEHGSNLYRGTNLAEIEMLKANPYVDKFLVTTINRENAENEYAAEWNRPASINFALFGEVPFLRVADVLDDSEHADDVLIAPFTKIKYVHENSEKTIDKNSKTLKIYNIDIEKQILDALSEDERWGLYKYILDNSMYIEKKIEECISLEKENTTNFENIRKLEQLLNKYENVQEDPELEDESIIENVNDFDRINSELKELKEISTDLFEKRKDKLNFINMWKRNIAVYMIAECKEIEDKIFTTLEEEKASEVIQENQNTLKVDLVEENKDNSEIKTEESKEDNQEDIQEVDNQKEEKKEDTQKVDIYSEEKKEESEPLSQDTIKINPSELKTSQDTIKIDINNSESNTIEEKNIPTPKITESTPKMEKNSSYIDGLEVSYSTALASCNENIESVERMLMEIKDLISKQQNHAKIAGNVGASYSALNNAFDMKKVTESLLDDLNEIKTRIEELKTESDDENASEKFKLIAKNNIEINTLLNYVNNPKIAVKNSKATRFDEMAIIEENELKRVIAQKIREIRGEAELRKLKDDLEIINDKTTFERFIGFFTGRNKLDEFMIDQIDIRQKAIRKTLAKKLSLAHNYSIHELIAEISMFIDDNEDDELVERDVLNLKKMSEELKRNFVVSDFKVRSIVDEKEHKNLPVEKRKLSKQEVIEVETYRFLNKYGYDISPDDKEEPKYQDTMSHEISRVIEYINSSSIL